MPRCLVVLVALATGAHATGLAARESAAALPAWLQITESNPGRDAAVMYQDYLRYWMRQNYSSEQMVTDAIANPRLFNYNPNWPRDRPEADNPAVQWKFFASARERWPHAAYRLERATSPPYRVTAEVYCGEDALSCDEVMAELAALKAPEPREPALRKPWLELVREESCALGTPSLPPPRYPAEAHRRGIGGSVQVRGIHNRCGDVRSVEVAQSSGDRLLDAAALAAAGRWKLADSLTGGKPGVFEAQVDFVPAKDPLDSGNARTTVQSVWTSKRKFQ